MLVGKLKALLEAPVAAPKPNPPGEAPKAGALDAPKAGVLVAPNAGVLEPKAGVLLNEKAAGVLAPKAGLLLPKLKELLEAPKVDPNMSKRSEGRNSNEGNFYMPC